MKTVIVGDIHGRTIWKDILEKESPDRMVFLGDYVSTHEDIDSQQQIDNLMEILEAKEANSQKIVLLRGNHDMQHLGYWWAECSGFDRKVQKFMCDGQIWGRFLDATQWVYMMQVGQERVVCSHAGISKLWMDTFNIKEVADINLETPSPAFGFRPASLLDFDGNSISQPCVWIRPSALTECAVPDYTQIVAHTPIKKLYQHKIKGTDNSIWFCDTLGLDNPAYLIIEDEIFTVRCLKD